MEEKNRGLANCRVRVKQRILAGTETLKDHALSDKKRLRCAAFGRVQIMKWDVGRVLCQKNFGTMQECYHNHIYTSIKIIKNEVGCRDDTMPKTVDTRRHCEEE